jgi:prepilin-type processing-associated H-X9-DG protein
VVVGIIAVLVGLVLAGGFGVRGQLDKTRCTANLLQIGSAVSMYVADWGTTPLVYTGVVLGDGPGRPPPPPPGHDLATALRDYVSTPDTFRCPGFARTQAAVEYTYNPGAVGLRPSQIHTAKSRALVACDPAAVHGGRMNCLFLDGHVRAYPEVHLLGLWMRTESGRPGPLGWPPD